MKPADTGRLRVAVVGAGWAGLAAAVGSVQAGHAVTVFEAARQLGGRARAVPLALPDGRRIRVDNGQHILIGAYRQTLALLRTLGIDPAAALLRQPLALTFPDGQGLRLPDGPAPLDAVAGILTARGWTLRDKLALLRTALRWQRAGFRCADDVSVAELCRTLTPALQAGFIEPLCVSALNTAPLQASGRVFLRVLQDALFSQRGGSNLLLPRTDLGTLLPEAAARWLQARGARIQTGQRIEMLQRAGAHWLLGGALFDRVIVACAAPHAARLVQASSNALPPADGAALRAWSAQAAGLAQRSISTVYAQLSGPDQRPATARVPMLALRSGPQAPAQFVLARDAIVRADPPTGLLAFVVSDSHGTRAELEQAVVQQAAAQLHCTVEARLTVTEKRATFACTPGLARPAPQLAAGLLACGDFIDGPYPATLEGAVRSGLQAAQALQ